MAPLESGTYSIQNVRFRNVAVLPNDDRDSDIVGRPEENSHHGVWYVSRLANGKYAIQNQAIAHYARSAHGAGEGDPVYGGERARQLTITEMRISGTYTISPLDADLFWGLPDGETDTPIVLAVVETDTKNQWKFTPIVDMPQPLPNPVHTQSHQVVTAYETPPMSSITLPVPSITPPMLQMNLPSNASQTFAPNLSSGSSGLGRDTGNPPLQLLAFDGGGIRGLSSLIILQDIMEEIRLKRYLDEPPRPYEFFDLIGGTSTGGLIAILLGRLRMSVSDAIAVYLSLAKEVFTTSVFRFFGPNTFDHKKLEESIKKVIRDKTGSADSSMRDTLEGRCCRTFVLALHKDAAPGGPTFLRTYTATRANPALCTIWQAGRATTAAPSFFESVSVPMATGGVHADLVDAGMGYNNPSQQVLEEARRIWGEERQVGCLLSIGTGRQTAVGLGGGIQLSVLLRAAKACVKVATDCERTHQDILRHAGTTQQFPATSYFRFNVDQGMQGVGLGEWEKFPQVVAHTQSYMNAHEVDTRKSQCVESESINCHGISLVLPPCLCPVRPTAPAQRRYLSYCNTHRPEGHRRYVWIHVKFCKACMYDQPPNELLIRIAVRSLELQPKMSQPGGYNAWTETHILSIYPGRKCIIYARVGAGGRVRRWRRVLQTIVHFFNDVIDWIDD